MLDSCAINMNCCGFWCCITSGGGAESEAYYPQWRRINQSIERPSVLNESLIRLIEGIYCQYFFIIFEELYIVLSRSALSYFVLILSVHC